MSNSKVEATFHPETCSVCHEKHASVPVADPAPMTNQEPPPAPPPAHTDEG